MCGRQENTGYRILPCSQWHCTFLLWASFFAPTEVQKLQHLCQHLFPTWCPLLPFPPVFLNYIDGDTGVMHHFGRGEWSNATFCWEVNVAGRDLRDACSGEASQLPGYPGFCSSALLVYYSKILSLGKEQLYLTFWMVVGAVRSF